MTEEEPEPEGSGCAGVAVLTAAALVLLTILYSASPDFFILGVGALPLAWFGYLWAAKKYVFDAPNPAPPPPPERGSEEEPQVTVVRDTSHPNRWLTPRPSKWLDWTDEDRDES